MSKPVITSLEALEDVFFADNKPYWRLYSGTSVSGRGATRIGENKTTEDMQESWGLLVGRLNSYVSGTFSIATQNNIKASNDGSIIHTIKLGTDAVGAVRGTNSGQRSFDDFLKFWEIMNKHTTANDEAMIEGIGDQVKQQLELERLKRELKEAKKQSRQERITGMVIDRLPAILDAFLPGTNVAINGVLATDIKDQAQSIKEEIQEMDEEEGEDNEEMNFSIDALVFYGHQLQALLEIPADKILIKLLKFAKANPEQAKALIEQI